LLEHLQISLDAVLERSRDQTRLLKSMGADFNAYTHAETTSYDLHVARRFWPQAAQIFAQAFNEPMLDTTAIAIERAIVAQEAATEAESPIRQFFWNTLSHLFAGTPYAHAESRSSYGSETSLANASSERLTAWRELAYTAGAPTWLRSGRSSMMR